MRPPGLSSSLLLLAALLLGSRSLAQAQQIPSGLLERLAGASPTQTEQLPAETLLEGTVDPLSYRLGPGDRLRIQSTGKATLSLLSTVDAEGWLSLGDYGSVEVGGLTLDEGRRRIRSRLGSLLRESQVEVRLQEIRRFKVFVLGEVAKPDAYTVTAATRAAEAIAMAGGTLDSASVRGIRILRRSPASETAVDLAAFRIAGSLEGNPFLLDGDRIVVPRRGPVFGLHGAVEHPGVWDLREGETLAGVLEWAGLAEDADTTRAFLARFRESAGEGAADRYDTLRVALDRVLRGEDLWPLADGDRVFVAHVPRRHEAASVRVEGAVNHPGDYPILLGTHHLRDAIAAAGGLLPDALPTRVTLVRRTAPDSTSLLETLRQPAPVFEYTATEQARLHLAASPDAGRMTLDLDAGADPLLLDGDRILVPRAQGGVEVAGEVAHPGFYAYTPGWDASDYLDAAGGTTRHADTRRVRLLRGPEGTAAEARKAGPLAPGDILFVPEKSRNQRGNWDALRDAFGIAAQVATIVLIIDQVRN